MSGKGERGLGTSIALVFKANGTMVTNTSQFILHFFDSVLLDPGAPSRVALAAHELLENAVKYSSGGLSHLDVEAVKTGGEDGVRITLRNRAPPERIQELCAILDQISRSTDPLALYYEFIARTAEEDEGSGLGLVRIRAEAEMEIRYTVSGDEVTLIAETLSTKAALQ